LVAVVRFGAGAEVVADDLVEGCGHGCGRVAQTDEHSCLIVTLVDDVVAVVVAGGDVVDGQAHDPWQGLGVEQDEQADDAFGQVHALAIVEAPGRARRQRAADVTPARWRTG